MTDTAELRERFRTERVIDASDTNSARLSSVEFLLAHFEPMRCDSEGVSDCVRCNAVALARWMLKDLRAAVVTPAYPCEWCAKGNEPVNGVHRVDHGLQYLVCTGPGK